MTKQIIYRERSGQRYHYSTISDCQRYVLTEKCALRLVRQGKAKIIHC